MSTRIVFLGSGGGGNLKVVHQYLSQTRSDIELVGVVTDRVCGALSYAEECSISANVCSFERTEAGNEELLTVLNACDADLIITNVHKILSEALVEALSGKLINLHYSYLPAFGGMIGMNPIDAALAHGNTWLGTTCHWVNEQVDAGKVISQGIFCRSEWENVYQKTFECGAITLLNAIFCVLNPTGSITKRDFNGLMISPAYQALDESKLRTIFEELAA